MDAIQETALPHKIRVSEHVAASKVLPSMVSFGAPTPSGPGPYTAQPQSFSLFLLALPTGPNPFAARPSR